MREAERGAGDRAHSPSTWTFPGSQDDEMEKGRPVATPEMHWRGQRDVALLYLPQGQCRWVLRVPPGAFASSQQFLGCPRALTNSYVCLW